MPKVSGATVVDCALTSVAKGGGHFLNITVRLPWVSSKMRMARATDQAITSPPADTQASNVGPVTPVEGGRISPSGNIQRGVRREQAEKRAAQLFRGAARFSACSCRTPLCMFPDGLMRPTSTGVTGPTSLA